MVKTYIITGHGIYLNSGKENPTLAGQGVKYVLQSPSEIRGGVDQVA